ncbi:MAG: serine/threonine-protein phosphatase [Acidobacteriaceae bacterium]|nr:serine/threonine-protein phosphatase [Acidobacteriaceae bacterium]
MLEVEFAGLSDPGLLRQNNEDCLGQFIPSTPELARSHGWLFVVADGVGGQDRGEVASHLAVRTLTEGFRKAPAREAHMALLPKLVQAANSEVFQTGLTAHPGGSNMATTVVACALQFDRAIVSHVGDSRCYLIRRNLAVSLTRDHTVSGEQARMRLISAREAASASTANLLSRSLGTNMFVNVETSEHRLTAGDTLLLCSDGLHHSVTAEDIIETLGAGSSLDEAAGRLVDVAKQRDGSDNISVQLIRIRAVERVGMYRGRHYKVH